MYKRILKQKQPLIDQNVKIAKALNWEFPELFPGVYDFCYADDSFRLMLKESGFNYKHTMKGRFFFDIDELKFHEDWNWLMLAISQLQSSLKEEVKIIPSDINLTFQNFIKLL